MTLEKPNAPTRRDNLQPWLALGLIALAWAFIIAGKARVDDLDLSRWGTNIDIPEALAIDAFRARHFWPFACAAIYCDFVAFVILGLLAERVRFGFWEWAISLALLISILIHGLASFATCFFLLPSR